MITLQRSIKMLRHYWKRTLLVTAVYTVLISVLLIMVFLNLASQTQIEDTQTGIGNSVFIRKVRLEDKEKRNSLSRFKEGEIETLTEDDRVISYNRLVWQPGNIVSGEPYIKDKQAYDDLSERVGKNLALYDNATFVGVTDSRYSLFFSGVGFCLKDGTSISKADEGKNVVLISDNLAEINEWKVGDKIRIAKTKNYQADMPMDFEVTIKGIYECPEASFLDNSIEYTPDALLENYIFIPQTTLADIDPTMYQTTMLYVYLKSPDMIEGYVQDMQNILEDVSDDITQKGWHTKLRFSWDEKWNQIVSAPFKEINNITRVVMWIVLAGTFAGIIFITFGELREKRKEIGVWIALGETRKRILIQTLLEKMIPIIAATIVALAVSLTVAEPISRFVTEDASRQFNEQIQGKQEDVTFWELSYILNVELEAGNYDYFYVDSEIDLYRSKGAITWSVCGGLAVLIMILTIQIWMILKEKPRELLGDIQ